MGLTLVTQREDDSLPVGFNMGNGFVIQSPSPLSPLPQAAVPALASGVPLGSSICPHCRRYLSCGHQAHYSDGQC